MTWFAHVQTSEQGPTTQLNLIARDSQIQPPEYDSPQHQSGAASQETTKCWTIIFATAQIQTHQENRALHSLDKNVKNVVFKYCRQP